MSAPRLRFPLPAHSNRTHNRVLWKCGQGARGKGGLMENPEELKAAAVAAHRESLQHQGRQAAAAAMRDSLVRKALAAGVSSRELAEALGITQQRVSKIATGKSGGTK